MTSHQHAGQHSDHAAVRARAATSTPPRRTCRPLSRRRSASCPGTCRRPVFRKVNPAASPILYYALRTDHAAAVRSSTNTPKRSWRSASRWSTAWRRCRCSARRSTPCAIQLDPQAAGRRATSASTRSRARSTTATSTCRPELCWGTDKAYTVQAKGQLNNAAEFGAAGRRLSQRRAGAARRPRPGRRQRRRTTSAPAGSTAQRARRARRSSGSPGPTPSRWRSGSRHEVDRLRTQIPPSRRYRDPERPLA